MSSLLALQHCLVALAAATPDSSTAVREVVNFDFAWRHALGNPGAPARACGTLEEGVNYGTGGSYASNVPTATACCGLCAQQSGCLAWDWDMDAAVCWRKTDARGKRNQTRRVSGLMPAQAAVPRWRV